MNRRRSLIAAALLILLVVAIALAFRAVDTRPLPQVQPTRDVQVPTRPVFELAPTATPTTP